MKTWRHLSVDTAIITSIVVLLIVVRIISFGYLSSLSASNPSSYPYPVVAGDSIHYVHLADNLVTLHAYQFDPGVPYRGATPGYPVLLAGTQATIGSMTPLVLVQILFSALAVVLIYRMARTLLPARYALVPALIYALDPMVVFTDTTLMTDSIFNALLIGVVYLAFFVEHRRRVLQWFVIGLLLGIATLIRPIGQFLVLVFPALYLLRALMERKSDYGPRLKAACVCVVGFALVVTPWIVRNHTYFDAYEISFLGSYDLLTNDVRGYLAWRALARTSDPLPAILVMRHVNDPIFAIVDKEIAVALTELTPPGEDRSNYEGRLGMRYILNDPIRYGYFHGVNTIPFFISSSIATYGQTVRQLRDSKDFFAPASLSLLGNVKEMLHPADARSFMSAAFAIGPIGLEVLWWVLVTLAAIVAVVLQRKQFIIVFFAVLILYFAALTGPMSASRYRIPAEPYLLILSVVGVHALLNRKAGSPAASRSSSV